MIRIGPGLAISPQEIEVGFARSGGPGGQNVNKVETSVVLRFDAGGSPTLPDPVRRRLLRLAGRRASRSGVITVRARRHRTQEANRKEALRALVDLIRRAAVEPKPRRKTLPSAAARRRRLDVKRRRGRTKRLRRSLDGDAE